MLNEKTEHLTTMLRVYCNEAKSGKNPNKVYDNVDELSVSSILAVNLLNRR